MTRHEYIKANLDDLKEEGVITFYQWLPSVRLWSVNGPHVRRDFETIAVEAFIDGAFAAGLDHWTKRLDKELTI